MFWLPILNYWLAVGGILLMVVTIVLFVDYYYNQRRYYIRFIEKYVWLLLLLTTVGSVALSLVYSEYFGFVPCSLCWLQRIALYPQSLFTVMGAKTRETFYYSTYGIALSIFGFIVAVYHHIYQLLPKESSATNFVMPCLTDGSSDCATLVIYEFGFVTFPLLSAITFAFLIVLYLNLRRS